MTATDNDSGNDTRSNAYLEQRVSHLEELVSVLHERVERLEDDSPSPAESNRSVENDTEPDYSEFGLIDDRDQAVLTTLDVGETYKFNTIRRKYRFQGDVTTPGIARYRAETLTENRDLFEPFNGRFRFLGVGK